MKIIFSRKGFDSASGGVPSPIVDDSPLSLPIPTRMPSPTRYADLSGDIPEIVVDLTKGRITPDQLCHLDPDLDVRTLPRMTGWRGALGQVSAAQSHLANNNVKKGDLFLFWGLFRPVCRKSGIGWSYVGNPEHRIFGWLQIEHVLSVGTDPQPALGSCPWLNHHPHLANGWPANNTVYLAKNELSLAGASRRMMGYGLLKHGFRLTARGSTKPSIWTAPSWTDPNQGGTGMTYHAPERWTPDGKLLTAARGQEFVTDIGERREPLDWVLKILTGT